MYKPTKRCPYCASVTDGNGCQNPSCIRFVRQTDVKHVKEEPVAAAKPKKSKDKAVDVKITE